jgi:hypothetical protein
MPPNARVAGLGGERSFRTPRDTGSEMKISATRIIGGVHFQQLLGMMSKATLVSLTFARSQM